MPSPNVIGVLGYPFCDQRAIVCRVISAQLGVSDSPASDSTYLASKKSAAAVATTTTTAKRSSKCPVLRLLLPSVTCPAVFGMLIESWLRWAGSTKRRRANAVAATHPTAVVAKGRKMRKSIDTLENDSLTPPATPAPGSRCPPSIATTAIVEMKNMARPALAPARRAARRPTEALLLRHAPPTPTTNGTPIKTAGPDHAPTE